MFRLAWPYSCNIRQYKIRGRLNATLSSIKRNEISLLCKVQSFIRIHVFYIIFVVVCIPVILKLCKTVALKVLAFTLLSLFYVDFLIGI
jgi:hypothetical protein